MIPLSSIIDQLREGEALRSEVEVESVTRRLFVPATALPDRVDFCVILGSQHCEYRVQAALDQCGTGPHRFVVSGGGRNQAGRSEADRMKHYLIEHGVDPGRIWSESISKHTRANLVQIESILVQHGLAESDLRIALFTGGFHLRRTMALLRETWQIRFRWRVWFGSAYGPRTHPENWHQTPAGRMIIGHELARLELMPDALG